MKLKLLGNLTNTLSKIHTQYPECHHQLLSKSIFNPEKGCPFCHINLLQHLSSLTTFVYHHQKQRRTQGTVQPSCLAINPDVAEVPLGSAKQVGGVAQLTDPCHHAVCGQTLLCRNPVLVYSSEYSF